jgi:hypothetical protein
MRRWWLVSLAIAIVVGSGIAHGLCTDRWSPPVELQEAVKRLASLPSSIADWDGTDLDNDLSAKFRADIPGFLHRRYVQRGSQREITVAIVCGRPGPISVHTPDVCYQGAGYRLTADPTKHVVSAPASRESAPLWKATFLKETFPTREELRVYWSWHAGDSWQAVKEPRLAFARFPVLHKLYVIYRVPLGANAAANDPCPEFLQQLLPEINAHLFPS